MAYRTRSDAECLRVLAGYILHGTLLEAFKENPSDAFEIVVGAVRAVWSLFAKTLATEVEGISRGSAQAGQVAIDAETWDATYELAEALGVTMPSGGLFSGLALKALLAALTKYLAEHGDEILDQLLNLIFSPPDEPLDPAVDDEPTASSSS